MLNQFLAQFEEKLTKAEKMFKDFNLKNNDLRDEFLKVVQPVCSQAFIFSAVSEKKDISENPTLSLLLKTDTKKIHYVPTWTEYFELKEAIDSFMHRAFSLQTKYHALMPQIISGFNPAQEFFQYMETRSNELIFSTTQKPASESKHVPPLEPIVDEYDGISFMQGIQKGFFNK